MKTDGPPPRTPPSTLRYVLAYLLWLVSLAACLAAVLQLRAAVNVLWPAFGASRYALGLANQVSLLLGGFAAFVYVVFLEGSYRAAVQRGDSLLRRFAVTITAPIGVVIVSVGLVEVGLRVMR